MYLFSKKYQSKTIILMCKGIENGPFRSWALGGRTGSPRVRSGPRAIHCSKFSLMCSDPVAFGIASTFSKIKLKIS
jgi:hypothetical protein